MFLAVQNIYTKEMSGFSLKNITFGLSQSKTLGIAGATGSGKSTLLKIVAGIESPSSGNVYFKGERVKKIPEEKLIPGHPGIAYLSQYFELRNHYRMEELMSYANLLTQAESERIFQLCKVDHLLKRKSDEISGGEKQRLALARLLISKPELLILDEPYSNLDLIHKNLLKSVISGLKDQLNISIILVSHDPSDLLSATDEMLIIRDGALIQQGAPATVYLQPFDEYSGALLGKYNLVPSELLSHLFREKGNTKVFIRPEHIHLSESPAQGSIPIFIAQALFTGPYFEVHIRYNAHKLVLFSKRNWMPGSRAYITFEPGYFHLLK